MNNKKVLTKKTSAIFLAIVLVAGTITLISPSFMTNVQAFQMDNNYENHYGKDSYKSKDSSVNIKKVKCNNINVNVNGLELDVLPPSLGNLTSDRDIDGYGSASSYGRGESYGENDGSYGEKSRSDGDFKFVCINNNNNTVVVEEPPVEDECEECFNTNTTLAGIITDILEVPGSISLFPVFPDISIGADVETIAQLCDFLEEQITEGNIPQSGLIDIILRILEITPEISEGVSEESVEALVECLSDIDFG